MNRILHASVLAFLCAAPAVACSSSTDAPASMTDDEDMRRRRHDSGTADSAVDAGATTDAGATSDEGTTADSGAGNDAGTTADSGATDDASASADAGGSTSSCQSWQPSGAVVALTAGADLQGAIDGASAGTILALAAGTYNITRDLNLKSGVSIACAPGAVLKSEGSGNTFLASGVSNVAVWGCDFDGTNNSGGFTAAIFVVGGDHLYFMNNNFRNFTSTGYLMVYNADDLAFSGNTNVGNSNNELQPMSVLGDDGKAHYRNYFSDNKFSGFTRMGFEAQLDQDYDFHFDRNEFTFTAASYSQGIALSIVSNSGSPLPASGTISGNKISGSAPWGIEIGTYNMTISDNLISDVRWGVVFASSPGTAVLDNTFTNVATTFGEDGGYTDDFWVGTNTVDGSSVTGWPGHGVSAQPTLNQPSQPFCAPK